MLTQNELKYYSALQQKKYRQKEKKFIVEGQGVRCVSDEPWVTIAETSEFVLALFAMAYYVRLHLTVA